MMHEESVKKGVSWSMIAVGGILVLFLCFISSPIIFTRASRSHATQAINNAKDIYMGLREYSIQYGSLPSKRETSNDCFKPLFEEGFFEDEKPFFVTGALHVKNAKEGDGDISSPDRVLEEGCNAYSYWTYESGVGIDLVRAEANTPVLSTPMLASSINPSFGKGLYSRALSGQAVILRADGSCSAHHLTEEGFIDESSDVNFDAGGDSTPSKHRYRVVHPAGCKTEE